jgi:hypothetical protein
MDLPNGTCTAQSAAHLFGEARTAQSTVTPAERWNRVVSRGPNDWYTAKGIITLGWQIATKAEIPGRQRVKINSLERLACPRKKIQ